MSKPDPNISPLVTQFGAAPAFTIPAPAATPASPAPVASTFETKKGEKFATKDISIKTEIIFFFVKKKFMRLLYNI